MKKMTMCVLFGFGILVGLFVIMALSEVSSAATIYVDDDGGADYVTIQEAINNASAGDTVYVYEGHYYENIVVNKSISLTGEDRDNTIIDGVTSGDVVIIEVNSVNISGFGVWNSGFTENGGIILDSVGYCNIFDNRFLNNHYGIKLTYSSNNNISNNHITDNWQGIYVQQFGNNDITGNTIIFNSYLGIHLRYSPNNYLAGNDIQSNDYGGIRLVSSSNNDITNNILINNYGGIELFPSSNSNHITSNEISEHGNNGVFITSSSNNNIINDNELQNNNLGILAYDNDGNTYTGNSFAPNKQVSIMLVSSTDSKISTNSMVQSGVYLYGDLLEHWNTHDIDTENTVNGKPVYYWKDRSDGTLDMDAGQVILANCNNVQVQNQDIDNTSIGILMGFSSNCNISVNSLSSNLIGLYVAYSSENILTYNNFSLNDNGVYLEKDSDNNLIYHNNFIDNINQSYDNCTNSWDNGYPSGGNYWSNYTGLDEYSGPDQDQQESDGIGDTPYYFEQSSQDNYPLIEPWVLDDPPSIVSTSPPNGTTDVGLETEIVVEFSEPMNTESVENAISIMPNSDYSFSWSNEDKTLTITFSESLDYMTLYQISIGTSAEDLAGNGLEEPYEFVFTTKEKPKEEKDFPIIYLLLTLLLTIIVAVIIVWLILTKKKKRPQEKAQPQIEVPQTIQITCPNCNKLLQVNDIGVTMNVTCPFCSTLLTVKSRKAPVQKPEPQQPTIQISCPQCSYAFQVINSGGLMQVQCPNCGISGKVHLGPSTPTAAQVPIAAKASAKSSQHIKCPGCNSVFTVGVTARPISIQCPSCGLKGELR
jgi:parallel beta-helix repeat protein